MSEKALKKAAAPKEAVASVCGALEEATFFLIRCSLQLNGKISVECVELRVVASERLLNQFSLSLKAALKSVAFLTVCAFHKHLRRVLVASYVGDLNS